MKFSNSDPTLWREALSSYSSQIEALGKPNLVSLDDFYRNELPLILHKRKPSPYITTSELSKLMQWKLTRGKWRPRLLDFVSSLDESLVKLASQKAFQCLPDISKAVSELTPLKGVGPATASAILAAYAPDVAPFMSDEAMEAALGNSKDYSLKQYLLFANKLQEKAKVCHAKLPRLAFGEMVRQTYNVQKKTVEWKPRLQDPLAFNLYKWGCLIGSSTYNPDATSVPALFLFNSYFSNTKAPATAYFPSPRPA
ncbi:hypothetical protein E5676_scaffold134G002390 [Cucumis melo var. makuwa]|uniref:Uncharacterized protein n=1 Tax=Cucumis melo var. makuwa TaxID=1194695 RepID=A0A5D3D9C6_CUCMM|nr:hypothetical protein E5676_scaffold134G002390 [Cucumis melo var. makuwa]